MGEEPESSTSKLIIQYKDINGFNIVNSAVAIPRYPPSQPSAVAF